MYTHPTDTPHGENRRRRPAYGLHDPAYEAGGTSTAGWVWGGIAALVLLAVVLLAGGGGTEDEAVLPPSALEAPAVAPDATTPPVAGD